MARKNDSILLDLIELPWWASVIVAAIVYAGLTFVLPAVLSKAPLLKGVPMAAASSRCARPGSAPRPPGRAAWRP